MNKKESKSVEFEIEFCKGILKRSPKFIEALSLLGDLYTKRGSYKNGLLIDEQLSQLKPKEPIVFYNLACSYSLVNDLDKSFGALKKAVRFGYDDWAHFEKDKDLDNLRSDSRFQRYWQRLRKQKSIPVS